MEYKVTFEDGSSAYLMHYGVKGMKWNKHKFAKSVDDLAFNIAYDTETNAIKSNVKDYHPTAASNYALHNRWMNLLKKKGASQDTLDYNKSEYRKERAKVVSKMSYNKAAKAVSKLFGRSSGVSRKIRNRR